MSGTSVRAPVLGDYLVPRMIHLTPSLDDQIDQLAHQEGKTKEEVMRKLLTDALRGGRETKGNGR